MKYLYNLGLRLFLCFLPISWISFVFTPMTVFFSYYLVGLFFNVILLDNILFVNEYPFRFIEACIASVAYYFVWVLVMLTKDIKLFYRILMIFLGFSMIFVMNVLRIFILIYIGINYGLNFFDSLHLVFWQFVSGIYVVFVWVFLVSVLKIKSIPVWSDFKELIFFLKNK